MREEGDERGEEGDETPPSTPTTRPLIVLRSRYILHRCLIRQKVVSFQSFIFYELSLTFCINVSIDKKI